MAETTSQYKNVKYGMVKFQLSNTEKNGAYGIGYPSGKEPE